MHADCGSIGQAIRNWREIVRRFATRASWCSATSCSTAMSAAARAVCRRRRRSRCCGRPPAGRRWAAPPTSRSTSPHWAGAWRWSASIGDDAARHGIDALAGGRAGVEPHLVVAPGTAHHGQDPLHGRACTSCCGSMRKPPRRSTRPRPQAVLQRFARRAARRGRGRAVRLRQGRADRRRAARRPGAGPRIATYRDRRPEARPTSPPTAAPRY